MVGEPTITHNLILPSPGYYQGNLPIKRFRANPNKIMLPPWKMQKLDGKAVINRMSATDWWI
jgi:hypothetical protein